MRITDLQKNKIRQSVESVLGKDAQVLIFGSRLDDAAKGGDIDILVRVTKSIEKPASVSASIAAKIMMNLQGQKIDVLLEAPDLTRLPIHEIALETGELI